MRSPQDIELLEELFARLAQRGAEAALVLRDEVEPGGFGPRWLDTDGAAAYLSMTPEGVRSMQKRGQMPFVRVPETGRIRFDRLALDAWMEGSAS